MSSEFPSDGPSSDRLSRPNLFMGIAHLYSLRATCPRASVGVVAVRDGRIIAAGYNGAPSGLAHCTDVGCLMVDEHCVRTVHAEANLVSWAARTGTMLASVTVYSTTQPCLVCSKLLINAGVVRVVYRDEYDVQGLDLIDELLEIEKYAPQP